MAWLDRDGARLHYETHGDGPALLLTHGFGASALMWQPNVESLARRARVITWDMRGHGETGAATAYSHDHALADMAAILEATGTERAVLCGMSLGGFLSLAFRLRHPERVAGLVLVDTGPGYRRDSERDAWNAYVERTAADLEARGPQALHDSPEVSSADAAALAQAARGIMAQRDASVIESLPDIDVPTLVVVGSEDAPFLRAADYMAARIPGARKLVIPGAGHAANMDAPDTFNDAVLDFLA